MWHRWADWQVVRADMIVQLKVKLASGALSPLGERRARALLAQLQREEVHNGK